MKYYLKKIIFFRLKCIFPFFIEIILFYYQLSLDIAFDQQLFGPIILKSNATFNLDSDSKDYSEFINFKISLNLVKRSDEIVILYQPQNESGDISFTYSVSNS